MYNYLPHYQQYERYRYTDMFLSLYFHVILLSPPRVWFFSPGHARSSTSWNEHYCLSWVYRYTDMFLSLYFHTILLSPPRVWFFSPGHARSSTSWNEHYCLSCLKYRSLKAESHLSFHCIPDTLEFITTGKRGTDLQGTWFWVDASSDTFCGICKASETPTASVVFATVGPETDVGGIREMRIFCGFLISNSERLWESHSRNKKGIQL